MTAAEVENGVFEGGPPRRLEDTLHLAKAGAHATMWRMLAVVLIGRAPLLLLACVQTFALIVRAYVPTEPILAGTYRLPDVRKS